MHALYFVIGYCSTGMITSALRRDGFRFIDMAILAAISGYGIYLGQ